MRNLISTIREKDDVLIGQLPFRRCTISPNLFFILSYNNTVIIYYIIRYV